MNNKMKQACDEGAKIQGNNHAHPAIRSMYPSKSRGQMAAEFAQLYSLGFQAAAALYEEQRKVDREREKKLVEIINELFESCPEQMTVKRQHILNDILKAYRAEKKMRSHK